MKMQEKRKFNSAEKAWLEKCIRKAEDDGVTEYALKPGGSLSQADVQLYANQQGFWIRDHKFIVDPGWIDDEVARLVGPVAKQGAVQFEMVPPIESRDVAAYCELHGYTLDRTMRVCRVAKQKDRKAA